jgi:hypothetical protein
MPSATPAPQHARADAARRNGALSRGPVTPEGKARSARNAIRHGLRAKTPVPADGGEDAAALAALRGALVARHLPRDEAEAHWVEELAFAAWRQRRLRALEAEVLARAGAAEEPEAAPALPSPSTLVCYRARPDRDWRRANEELELVRRDRAVQPSPAQLRLVADLIERGQAAAATGSTPDHTNETPASGTNEPAAPIGTTEPASMGTSEPDAPSCTNEPAAHGTDGPTHPVPPLPETRTSEPDDLPRRPLNRHQRRRLAALARRGLRRAA